MLLAGEIGKPHGLNGEVFVLRISDDPARFDIGATLTHEDGRSLVVASSRQHRDRFLVAFEGHDSRPAAESLRGALYVDEDQRRELAEGEFWVEDLRGATVHLPSGDKIGVIDDVIVGAAQDLLSVSTERGPRLIPNVTAIVIDVDIETRRVTIDPPIGLLD